jgi:hypothetical protein
MTTLLLAMLFSVTLQPPFGEAGAQVLGTPAARTIDVTVEVEGEPVAVLARITTLAGEQDPVALVPRGENRYGQAIKLTGWEDVVVAFEYIGADGTTSISAGSTLTDLGIDPAVINPERPATTSKSEGFTVDPWLLAGGAAALAAVVLMAFWASGSLGETMKPDDWSYAAVTGDAGQQSEGAGEVATDEPAG